MSIMAAPGPPPSMSIPDAPRIGTAGSPLDPPPRVRSPREGLGLDRKFDSRYAVFKTPRHHRQFRGHAASVSSPPSLIPFVKSLHDHASATSDFPQPSVTSRKFSLQSHPSTTAVAHGHARKASEGGLISYPIVSRIDSLPTFTPDEERRPAPIPTTTINDHRSAPPPPPAPSSAPPALTRRAQPILDEDRTPTPKQRRPSRSSTTTRTSPPPPLDLEFPGGSNYAVFPVKAKSRRRGSSSSATTATDKRSTRHTLRGLRISHAPSSRTSSQYDSSEHENDDEDEADDGDEDDCRDSPMMGRSGSGSYGPRRGSLADSYPGHRRAASEESPRIVQAVTFTRARSAEDVVPTEQALRQFGGSSTSGAPPAAAPVLRAGEAVRTWNTASPALIPISEAKAAKAKAQALDSPTRRTNATTRAAVTKPAMTRTQDDSANSVKISVKSSGAGQPQLELGTAPLARDGTTVCLTSYARPDEVEVSWSCVPKIDAGGRAYTQWEMRFKPRTSSNVAPAHALPPLPTGSISATSNSNFLNYRINASSSPPPGASANYASSSGRAYSTTSPLSQTVDPLAASAANHAIPPPLVADSRRRKSSSTSTSRSDSFSQGTSFSSESSSGPVTPASSIHGHRRRKSSSTSDFGTFDDRKELPPPLPTKTMTPSYFDIPIPSSIPPARAPAAARSQERSVSPSRQTRSSSYNIGRHASPVDYSNQVPRSASVPEAAIRTYCPIPTSSASVKSPSRDNRFVRCLPPSGEAVIDLASLAASTACSTGGSSGVKPLHSSSGGSFLASRKQSIAPPPSLSIPPLPVGVDESPSPSGSGGGLVANRITSPFTPSPLGRSANNSVATATGSGVSTAASSSSSSCSLASLDHNRTPTRSTHFHPSQVLSRGSTTPIPSPPPFDATAASHYSIIEHKDASHFEGGGTSEELVSRGPSRSLSRSLSPSPSPSFSDIEAFQARGRGDVDEDDDEQEDDGRMARLRQGKRMMSRWSDTETEEDEEADGKAQAGLTSWGRIPDSNTTTDEDE
ncbi:hypothetical protein JCM3766R1_000607 [Sporobolomyces carnicolor]